MSDYREYYTVVYRDDQRMIILNDNAKPPQKSTMRSVSRRYYAEKTIGGSDILPDKHPYARFGRTPLRLF